MDVQNASQCLMFILWSSVLVLYLILPLCHWNALFILRYELSSSISFVHLTHFPLFSKLISFSAQTFRFIQIPQMTFLRQTLVQSTKLPFCSIQLFRTYFVLGVKCALVSDIFLEKGLFDYHANWWKCKGDRIDIRHSIYNLVRLMRR